MPGNAKVNGTWQDLTKVHAKVNGTWQEIAAGFTNVNGSWSQWFSAGPTLTNGYMVGGYSGTRWSNLDKFSWTTDTRTATISASVYGDGVTTFSNSVSGYGYHAGGFNGATSSSVVSLQYSTDSVTTGVSTLAQGRYEAGGTTSDGDRAYVAGGRDIGSSTVSSVDKFSMPSVSRSTTTALPAAKEGMASLSNPDGYCYFVGGGTSGGTSTTNTKYTFATDTQAGSTVYPSAVNRSGEAKNWNIAGYVFGSSRFDKFPYATEVWSSIGTQSFITSNQGFGATSGDGQKALIHDASSTAVRRLDYTTDILTGSNVTTTSVTRTYAPGFGSVPSGG